MERLGELLNQLDCKKATRSEVIAAVRAMLGETAPAASEPSVTTFVDRCIRRLVKAVDRLQEKFPAADEQAQVRELLKIGLNQVLESLQSPGKLPNRRSPPVNASSVQEMTE